jgi:hypothetical protein
VRAVGARADLDAARLPAAAQRLDAVLHEVDEHLLQRAAVGEHLREVRRQHRDERDLVHARVVREQVGDGRDDLVERDARPLGPAAARDVEQVLDDARRARGLLADAAEELLVSGGTSSSARMSA